jgi:hypothetical protein
LLKLAGVVPPMTKFAARPERRRSTTTSVYGLPLATSLIGRNWLVPLKRSALRPLMELVVLGPLVPVAWRPAPERSRHSVTTPTLALTVLGASASNHSAAPQTP